MANQAGPGKALDNSLPTVFSAFKLLRQETGIMRSCATDMPLKPHEGTSKHVNNYGRVITYDLADAVDIVQAQDLEDTTTSYTPAEVGVQVILPGSTMRRIQDPSLLKRTGRMLSNSYDLKEDGDGCAQLVNFTPIVGAAAALASPGYCAAAMGILRVGNSTSTPEPAPDPKFIVMHPNSAIVLEGRLVPYIPTATTGGTSSYGAEGGAHAGTMVGEGGAGPMGEDIIRRGIGAVGTIAGATLKLDANLTVDSSGDAHGAAFSKEGLIFVQEVAPRMDPDTSDKSMRGAVELNLWGSFVWGLYRSGAYGCEMYHDASLPSS